MNRNNLVEDHSSRMLVVDTTPIPLRLPPGSAIFVYSGEVWITQEGMHDDVVLGPGEQFAVKSRASILASAISRHSPAHVYIACPTEAGVLRDGDLFALLHRRARRLRAEQFGRWLTSIRRLVFPDQVRSSNSTMGRTVS